MLDRAPRKHTWGVHPAVAGALAAAAAVLLVIIRQSRGICITISQLPIYCCSLLRAEAGA